MSTPITQEQYDQLVNRINFAEAVINNIINLLSKFATLDQVNQLTLMRQTEIDNLTTRTTSLENKVDQLQTLITI